MHKVTHEAFYSHPELRKALEPLATTVCKKKGAVLFREGQKPNGVYVIRAGQVELSVRATTDGAAAPRIAGPGAVIGLPGNISGKAFSLTAKALDECELGFVPRAKFVKLLRSDGQLCLHAVQVISKELATLRHEVGGISQQRAAAMGQ